LVHNANGTRQRLKPLGTVSLPPPLLSSTVQCRRFLSIIHEGRYLKEDSPLLPFPHCPPSLTQCFIRLSRLSLSRDFGECNSKFGSPSLLLRSHVHFFPALPSLIQRKIPQKLHQFHSDSFPPSHHHLPAWMYVLGTLRKVPGGRLEVNQAIFALYVLFSLPSFPLSVGAI